MERARVWGAVLVLAILFLAGCGESGEATTSSQETTPAGGTQAQTTTTGAVAASVSTQSGEYSVELIKVDRSSEPVLTGMKKYTPNYLTPAAGHVILSVTVDLYHRGEPVTGAAEAVQLSLVDPDGETYAPDPTFNLMLMDDGTFHTLVTFFEVPESTLEFTLNYRDAAPVAVTLQGRRGST